MTLPYHLTFAFVAHAFHPEIHIRQYLPRDPGPRPLYGPDFYGAYVRDLDGNKMSFVFFGDGD